MKRVAAILPPGERFDGHGGAIATWVRATYSASRHETIVVCPRSTAEYARGVTFARMPGYALYEKALRASSTILSRVIRKPFQTVYNRLLGSDSFWISTALKAAGDAEVIHLHNRPHYAKQLRKRGYRGKILLHMHNDLRQYVSLEQANDVFPYVDSVAFCSEFMRQRAIEAFGDIPRSLCLDNAVSPDQIDRNRQHLPDPEMRLVYAGRLIEEKGAREAVHVCAELRRRGINARIDIVGGSGSGSDNGPTPYLSAVREAVADLNNEAGVSVARMLGPVAHDDVFALFSASDAIVLPAQWEEPFGMVALEAMARGCVPFVTRRGGMPDVVRDGGVVVDADVDDRDGVVSSFADAIVRRREDLDALRVAGWDRAEELTWPQVTRQFDKAVDSVEWGR